MPYRRLLAALVAFAFPGAANLHAEESPAFEAARALYKARNYAEAQAAFEKLAASEPANPEIPYHLGKIIGARGEAEAAAKHIEAAIKLAPQNALYHQALGEAYGEAAQKASVFSQLGLAKKCLAAFLRAVDLEPGNIAYHQSLFDYYQQAPGFAGGGHEKAAAEAAVMVKVNPVRGQNAYITLYSGEKNYAEAYAHAAELKKLDPVLGGGAFVTLYTAEKKYDAALAELDAALKTSPDHYGAQYQVGKLAAVSGQYLDRGLASLRRCLELTPGKNDPSHAAAHWRIGNILEKKNDKAAARAEYEAAVKADPNFKPAADALKALK